MTLQNNCARLKGFQGCHTIFGLTLTINVFNDLY